MIYISNTTKDHFTGHSVTGKGGSLSQGMIMGLITNREWTLFYTVGELSVPWKSVEILRKLESTLGITVQDPRAES